MLFLDEADQRAKQIAVIDGGSVIAEGTPGQFEASVGGACLTIVLAAGSDTETAITAVKRYATGTVQRDEDGLRLSVPVPEAEGLTTLVVHALDVAGLRSTTSPSSPRRSTTCSSRSPATLPRTPRKEVTRQRGRGGLRRPGHRLAGAHRRRRRGRGVRAGPTVRLRLHLGGRLPLFGNPNPAASVHAWPMQHPELAVICWAVGMLAVFAPLAVRLYRRKALG